MDAVLLSDPDTAKPKADTVVVGNDQGPARVGGHCPRMGVITDAATRRSFSSSLRSMLDSGTTL
jgi:hypothetical protein